MKVEQANRSLNVAGGVIAGALGVIGWGVGIWAALNPYPAQTAVAPLPTPDAAVCRAHAQDLGFSAPAAPVAAAPLVEKGKVASPPPSATGEENSAEIKPVAKLPAAGAYKAPAGAWDFTAPDRNDPEVQLNAASALITRCAAELAYFCMGDGCRVSDGAYVRVVLNPTVPTAVPAPIPAKK